MALVRRGVREPRAMALSSATIRAVSMCIAVCGPACERGDRALRASDEAPVPGAPGDARWVGVSAVKGLPPLRIRVPHFVEPFTVVDPPVVAMFRERRPVDQPFHASLALQPAAERRSAPHCGLAGISLNAEATRAHEVHGPALETWRCEGPDGQRGFIVDRRLENAAAGTSYFCVASWWWDGPGPIAPEWNAVVVAIEQACYTIAIVEGG